MGNDDNSSRLFSAECSEFTCHAKLGQGAFSQVFLGRRTRRVRGRIGNTGVEGAVEEEDDGGGEVVIKVLRARGLKSIEREISILRRLRSDDNDEGSGQKHIVRLIATARDPASRYVE